MRARRYTAVSNSRTASASCASLCLIFSITVLTHKAVGGRKNYIGKALSTDATRISDFLGFGYNSMGSYFNPVSIIIINSGLKLAIDLAWLITLDAIYNLYKHWHVRLCSSDKFSFYRELSEQTEPQHGRSRRAVLELPETEAHNFQVDKQSTFYTNAPCKVSPRRS